jgi:hypothetical protein
VEGITTEPAAPLVRSRTTALSFTGLAFGIDCAADDQPTHESLCQLPFREIDIDHLSTSARRTPGIDV